MLRGAQLVTKGWEPAEADVENNTEGPDVYGSIVFPVIVGSQDLRRNI